MIMGESGISLDSAALISAAVVFPIVVFISGCVICRRLCGGSENDDEERQPLLTGGTREEPRVRIERVENEEHRQIEPERHSPRSHSVLTGEQPRRSEERIEETRQQESHPVVVAEAALIPDLLRVDDQEPERSHQTDPDILEPRPSPDNAQSPQNEEHNKVTVVTDRAQQEQSEPQVEEQPIPNSEDVQKITTDEGAELSQASQETNVKSQESTQYAEPEGQLIPNLGEIQDPPITTGKGTEESVESKVMNWDVQAPTLKTDPCDELESAVEQTLDESTPSKDLQKESPQDTQDPLLPKTPDESHSTDLQDQQTDVPATLIEALQQQGAAAVLIPSVEPTPADKEVKVDTVVEDKVQEDPEAVAVDQGHQHDKNVTDVEAVAAIDESKEPQKTDERIEDNTKEQKDEQSTSTQQHNEEVKKIPDEALTDTGASVKEQSEQVTEPESKGNSE